MSQKMYFWSFLLALLTLISAACQQAPEALELKATKVGEVADLTGQTDSCVPDGTKDQGIRLQIPAELGKKVFAINLTSSGEAGGWWTPCSGPKGQWRLQVTKDDSNVPLGEPLDLSQGGVFVIHVTDNGAFAKGAPLEVVGADKAGQEVFRVAVSGENLSSH